MQKTSIKLESVVSNICHHDSESRQQKISDRAYQIFLEEGSPSGRMIANWYEAEQELLLTEKHCLPMPCGCGQSTSSEHAK